MCKNAFLGTTRGLYAAEMNNMDSNLTSKLYPIQSASCQTGVAPFDQNFDHKVRQTVKNMCFTKLLMQDQGFAF